MTKNAFAEAVEKAERVGHVLVNDPPHELACVARRTCRKCGRAVLGSRDFAYGSATEKPCASV